jgi:flavin-binding protein dodecin
MVEKTVTITGLSANSIEDAVQIAIQRAGVTLSSIHTAHVTNISAAIEGNKVIRWKVTVDITFNIHDNIHE